MATTRSIRHLKLVAEVGYLSISTQKVVDDIDPILKCILSYIATPSINNLYCSILKWFLKCVNTNK